MGAETVAKASAIFMLATLFCLGVSWILLITQKATLSEAIFEAVSAFSTCGFTLGLTSRLDLFGQIVVACTMFCGRLGVLTVVVAMTLSSPSLVRYPEEKILIG